MTVAKYAAENEVPMAFNLSAVFLLQFEKDNVLAGLEYADYVFANEDECSEFGKQQGMEEGASRLEIVKKIASYKKVGPRPRIVICT